MSKKNYVDNKEMFNMIIEYRKTCDRKLYNKLGRMFLEIAINFFRRPNLINYPKSLKDAAISDAVFYMVKYFDRFDETRTKNPFAYFSQFVYNSAIQHINKYKESIEMHENVDNLDKVNISNDPNVHNFEATETYLVNELRKVINLV